jgi:hypothetical protein
VYLAGIPLHEPLVTSLLFSQVLSVVGIPIDGLTSHLNEEVSGKSMGSGSHVPRVSAARL